MTTPLDTAHAAMMAAPEDEHLRLTYYERFADAEVFLLLERPAGDTVEPKLLTLDGGPLVLVFDREDRLAEVAPDGADMIELSGRTLAAMLAGQGIGIGLNLGVAPSAFLMPPDAVSWLAGMVSDQPDALGDLPAEVLPLDDISKRVLASIEAKLPVLAGQADAIGLATGVDPGGDRRTLVAVLGARVGAQGAIASAIDEALKFSGDEMTTLDVVFPEPGSTAEARLRKVALIRSIPVPDVAQTPLAPGVDPAKPPKLR